MTNNLISVIIPVYKVEKYLDRCVESVVNQTYKNLEIILVDDGSPDNCPKMCDEWEKKDSRIKVIHKENGGVSSVRNMGLDKATGKYIAFVDGDDYLEMDSYENLLKGFSEGVDMVVGNFRKIGFGNNVKSGATAGIVEVNFDNFFNRIIKDGINPLWNKLYLKDKISFQFDKEMRFSEDLMFNLQYLKSCKKINYIPQVVYNYCANLGSVTHQFSLRPFYDNIRVVKFLEEGFWGNLSKEQVFLRNNYQMSLLLGTFKKVALEKSLSRAEKKNIFNELTNNETFLQFDKKRKTPKNKLHYFLIKHKMISILKLLYKFV